MQFHWSHLPLVMTPILAWIFVFGGGFFFLMRNHLFFFLRHIRLRDVGLELIFRAQPVDAEKCFREALQLGPLVPPEDRVALMVCLGDALADQKRYVEAKEYFERALGIGDPSGSCQLSICDLLLAMKTDGKTAIEMANISTVLIENEAHQRIWGAKWVSARSILVEASGLARKAQALSLLNRNDEAREVLGQSLKVMEDSRDQISKALPSPPFLVRLAIGRRRLEDLRLHPMADTHLQIALALLATGSQLRAAEELRIVIELDAKAYAGGKFRRLAQEKLNQFGAETD